MPKSGLSLKRPRNMLDWELPTRKLSRLAAIHKSLARKRKGRNVRGLPIERWGRQALAQNYFFGRRVLTSLDPLAILTSNSDRKLIPSSPSTPLP